MPKIDFNFEGWVTGASVDGNPVDVSDLIPEELCDKLYRGELFISLTDYLYVSQDREIVIQDCDPSFDIIERQTK